MVLSSWAKRRGADTGMSSAAEKPELLRNLRDLRGDGLLTEKQYDDEVSCGRRARGWHVARADRAWRMPLALHLTSAWEIAVQLGVAGREDEAAPAGPPPPPLRLVRCAVPLEIAPVRLLLLCLFSLSRVCV